MSWGHWDTEDSNPAARKKKEKKECAVTVYGTVESLGNVMGVFFLEKGCLIVGAMCA